MSVKKSTKDYQKCLVETAPEVSELFSYGTGKKSRSIKYKQEHKMESKNNAEFKKTGENDSDEE